MSLILDATRLEFRQGTPEDFEFLWHLQCEAMRPNVERQFGPWDETFQLERFAASTDPTLHEIIEFDREPVGCQLVLTHPAALELVRLYLLPAVQGLGIGTYCLERLIATADESRLPIRLQVFRTNPARALYTRLGFETVSRTESHATMERGISDGLAP